MSISRFFLVMLPALVLASCGEANLSSPFVPGAHVGHSLGPASTRSSQKSFTLKAKGGVVSIASAGIHGHFDYESNPGGAILTLKASKKNSFDAPYQPNRTLWYVQAIFSNVPSSGYYEFAPGGQATILDNKLNPSAYYCLIWWWKYPSGWNERWFDGPKGETFGKASFVTPFSNTPAPPSQFDTVIELQQALSSSQC
jgi:hypothetical protein